MTRVSFGKKGRTYWVKADGHAVGSSEVCAAVSGLMYALAGYLVNAERDGKVQVICSKMMPGEAEQRWEGSEAEDAAYNLVVIGLMQIAGSYPQYLEIGEG